MNGIGKAALAVVCGSLWGCPDKIPTPAPSPSDSASTLASATHSAPSGFDAGPNDPPPDPKVEMHAIEGLGDVPLWTEEHGRSGRCDASNEAKKRLETLDQGDDADISAGKANVHALKMEIAGACITTARSLAQTLTDGGQRHYDKKEYAIANQWWRAALLVRPALVAPRYDLVRGLIMDKKLEGAVWALTELARAAETGDPVAANFIEQAKSDKTLDPIHEDDGYKQAIASSHGGLVGPRKEPETAAAAVKLLPTEYVVGPTMVGGLRTYHPAFLDFWTWRPDSTTEFLVATIVHDPAALGKPKLDVNTDYGALAVLKREPGGKLSVMYLSKTGDSPPAVAAGKNGTVVYGFSEACGALKGMLIWRDNHVIDKEMTCTDLGLQ